MNIFSALLLCALFSGQPVLQSKKFKLLDYNPKQDVFYEQGKEARILPATGEGFRYRVIFRPNTEVEKPEDLGVAEDGHLHWTPKWGGLYKLLAYVPTEQEDGKMKDIEKAKVIISVRFAEGSYIGIIVMILAGLILFVGSYFSIRSLLRAERG